MLVKKPKFSVLEKLLGEDQYIAELTPQQIAKFAEYRDLALRLGFRTGPAVRDNVYDLVPMIYRQAELAVPKQYFFVPSPMAAAEKSIELLEGNEEDDDVTELGFSQFEMGDWIECYFYAKECDLRSSMPTIPIVDLLRNCGGMVPFDEAVIIVDSPEFIHLDSDSRLHSMKGHAIHWTDGFGVYSIHGASHDEFGFQMAGGELA
jgi:hypothetical protein